ASTERSFGTAQEVFANTIKTNEAIGALAKGQFEQATAQAKAEVEKATKAASKAKSSPSRPADRPPPPIRPRTLAPWRKPRGFFASRSHRRRCRNARLRSVTLWRPESRNPAIGHDCVENA